MAAAKIIVAEKNEGEKIAYEVSGSKIFFGDDELMVNLKTRERDEEVTLDICKDTQDGLTVGVNTEAREYVAQVTIPAGSHSSPPWQRSSPLWSFPFPVYRRKDRRDRSCHPGSGS